MKEFRNVCARCFSDADLKEMIRAHAGPKGCYFCGRRDAVTMPFDEVVEFILERIEAFYGRAGDQLPYESREGGYQGWHIDSYDMIRDQIELDLPRDGDGQLFGAIVDGIGDEVWCEYDWLTLEPDESLRFSWGRFCEIVKHGRRFFFHDMGRSKDNDPDSRSPFELLGSVCRHAEEAGLVVNIPAGFKLFRARSRKSRRPLKTPAELGPPPDHLATQSNRMNPPGISMFYGADRRGLAIAEIRNTMASVGCFATLRPVRILDLAHLPSIPGFFSTADRMQRLILAFLSDFADIIIEPVERTDRVNVDYIPTQVFTEFIRDFDFDGGKIDGLRYRSATREKGTNYVLFAGQGEVVGAAPPDPFMRTAPWLDLVAVKQVRL
ncbi:RES domain-containing protein [Rhizobium lusitanum]|uniref:RES domain-containing protein n=1 Tax=Rhizobium lusitanum TaxID=293958 RepID=A0A6L9UEA0_9HYPH|nr:HEPN-associated N-terminal domain-containing protein [Rhizobium lusitanum]NEI74315.1 RES domain-containing protein [Rhizobium lusitanum]